jgi:hypothetical protein
MRDGTASSSTTPIKWWVTWVTRKGEGFRCKHGLVAAQHPQHHTSHSIQVILCPRRPKGHHQSRMNPNHLVDGAGKKGQPSPLLRRLLPCCIFAKESSTINRRVGITFYAALSAIIMRHVGISCCALCF